MRWDIASGEFPADDNDDDGWHEQSSEKTQGNKTNSKANYPTFRGQGLGDLRAQIPGSLQSSRLPTVEEEEDLEAQLFEVEPLTPQLPSDQHRRNSSTDSSQGGDIPAPFRDMFKSMQPRFSAVSEATQYLPGLPKLNVMPATPSTIASKSTRRRRETMQSTYSGAPASASSSRSVSATSSSAFPQPPSRQQQQRPDMPSHAYTFGRRKSSSSHRPQSSLDHSKLMPPTHNPSNRRDSKIVKRPTGSGHSRTLTPPQVPGPTSIAPSATNDKTRRQSVVRFDLRPDSPASSDDDDLEDLLPQRPTFAAGKVAQRGRVADPFADDRAQFGRLASAAGV